MTRLTTCTRCGAPVDSEKLDGLCPACLLAHTLDVEDPGDEPVFWEDQPARKTPARTFSHFELLDELGRGGMGVVYRARDLNTERIVALKVLQAHHLEVPDLVQRFRSEVRAVSSLDHPNVLPIHEVGEHEGIPFFSMKLTTGGSLAHAIGNYLGRPMDAARMLAKISRGVQHAHERGILHRDLKPGNILIDSAGEPYVCDFGLAKWLEDDRQLTMTAAVLGTPHYIAPEQASGSKGLTTAVDIYSLGAILYELLTGRPPFVGTSVIETLVASQEKSPDRPSSLAKNVPRDLETICLKALQHDPGNRYPTAGAFADDLEAYLGGRPIQARPVGAAEQLWRWAKRNPLPATLVSLILVLLTVVAIGSTMAAISFDRERRRAMDAEAIAVTEKQRAMDELYNSLLAQAKASRMSGSAGQRFETLRVIRQASEIRRTAELRSEAIAALSLPDLRENARFPVRKNPTKQPLRFSDDLQRVALATLEGELTIVDLKRARIEQRFESPGTPIECIYHSGRSLVCVRHSNGALKVYEIESGRLLLELANEPSRLRSPRYSFEVCFSRDESIIALALADGGIALHSGKDGRLMQRLTTQMQATSLCFSPDGSYLALADRDHGIEVWSIPSARRVAAIDERSVISMAWDHHMLAAGKAGFEIAVFDDGNFEKLARLDGHKQEVTHVIFHPHQPILASTSRDNTVRIWDLRTHAEMVIVSGLGVEPCLKFSPDGSHLGCSDLTTSAVILEFEDASETLKNAAPPTPGDFAALVSSVDFSTDGRFLATGSFRSFAVFETKNLTPVWKEVRPASSESNVRFTGPRSVIVANRSDVPVGIVVPTSPGEGVARTRVLSDMGSGNILASPDGDRDFVTFTSDEGLVHRMDTRSLKMAETLTGERHVWDAVVPSTRTWRAISFSHRGPDTTVVLTGTARIELASGAGGTLAVSPARDRLITTGNEGAIVWDTATWTALTAPNVIPDWKHITTCTFSPDGRYVAASVENRVLLIDAKTWQHLATLACRINESQAYRVAFSPDSTLLATQGEDNSLRIWNLDSLFRKLAEVKLQWDSGH